MKKEYSKHRIVLFVATIILIAVAVFFARKMFVENPLQGKWTTSKGEYFVTFEGDKDVEQVKAIVLVKEELVDVELECKLDKKNKIVTFTSDPNLYDDAVKKTDGAVTAKEVDEQLDPILNSFEYSLDKDTLTLLERESGDKLTFKRVE